MFMSSAALGGVFAMIINLTFPGAHLSTGAYALVAMAAVFGAASRATFTFIVFAFEITRDYNSILPLMLGCVIADMIAIHYLPRSIMTEKLARRGLRVPEDYEAGVLKIVRVEEVMRKDIQPIPRNMTVEELAERISGRLPERGVANGQRSYNTPYGDFAPRLGFAWQPLSGGKLVVRGGIGIFYNRVGLDSVVHAYEQGYPYAATYDYSPPSSRWLAATLQQPYPAISLVCMPSDPNCNSDFGLGFAARYANATTLADSSLSTPFDPTSVHTPLVREYSLGTQYEFAHGWVLDFGYVGSSGINLLDYNHNQALLATPTNEFSSLCTGTPPICNTAPNAQFRVPYPGYQTDGLAGSDDNGYSNYNSLQVTVRHQFSHGLSMQAAYTWDKDLSTVFYSNTANINEALDMNAQYGRVAFDRPQRFVVNYSCDLPFGKGMEGVAGKLVSGWNISGITIVQSGDPLPFTQSGGALAASGAAYGTSTTSYLDGVSTAQYCSGFNNGNILAKGSIVSKVGTSPANGTGYFNLAGFCPAPIVPFGDATATSFGNSGVGAVLGPGQFNWDISILKSTKITERVNMQFHTDFYNAFNHPQFADPGGSTFGTIGYEDITGTTPLGAEDVAMTHTNVNPRLIQFGLRFTF
jgi:hypothetical protein